MSSEIPFKPITSVATEALNAVVKKRTFAEVVKTTLVCACLGPSKRNKAYALREGYKKHIQNKGHIALIPEEITQEEASLCFENFKIPEDSRKAILRDNNLLSEIIIINSDLIFILCEGEGPFIELGKYVIKAPFKVRVLLHEDKYFSETQLGIEIKSLQDMNPDCLITYKGELDLYDHIDRCIEVGLRNKMRIGLNG